MNNFIFENDTRTYFGKGCVKEYLACLLKHFGENVMFAYGKGSIKENGIYDEIMKSLSKAGKNIIEFSDIMPNPTYAKVLEGAKLARDNRIDFILAVGGGSVMDCCKAVSMAAVYEGIFGTISLQGRALWNLNRFLLGLWLPPGDVAVR